MKKVKNLLLVVGSLFILFLFLGACAEEETSQTGAQEEKQVTEQNDNLCGDGVCDSAEESSGFCSADCGGSENTVTSTETDDGDDSTPSWIPTNPSNGVWKSNLYMATSDDGLSFRGKELIVEHVGVPNLLLTSSVELIATYQYFSYETEELFGVIAYSVSEDDGKTWTDPVAVTIEGLPEATTASPSGPNDVTVTRAVDPTLVELEDGSLRLYFTYQEVDAADPHLASAINTDGDISGIFTYEEDSGVVPAEDAALLDPAVVYFDGLWHYYTWNVAQAGIGGSEPATSQEEYDNYHGTSEDGLTFTLQDPVTLYMGLLGQAVALDDGIRFYGTGIKGIVSAFSSDGYTFEMDEGSRLSGGGGDPGVAQLEDGTYVMIYTGPPSQN